MTYRLMLIQIALTLVVGCTTSSGPGTGWWQQAGLSGIQINTILAGDGMIFAAIRAFTAIRLPTDTRSVMSDSNE